MRLGIFSWVALVDFGLGSLDFEQPEIRLGVVSDKWVGGIVPPLTLGRAGPASKFSHLDERVESRDYQVRLTLGTFGDGLETAVVLFIVVEFVFDDAEEPLIEFEQRFDLLFVLQVEFLLLLDFLEHHFNWLLEVVVLLFEQLHANRKNITKKYKREETSADGLIVPVESC